MYNPLGEKLCAALDILRIEIPESAKRASPLYKKYQQPASISWAIDTDTPKTGYFHGIHDLVAPSSSTGKFVEVAFPVRPVRTQKGWTIPKLKIVFSHTVRFGEKYPFERYVPVKILQE